MIVKKCLKVALSIFSGGIVFILSPLPFTVLLSTITSIGVYFMPNIISKVKLINTKNIINFNDYIEKNNYESMDELIEESEFLVDSKEFIKEQPNAYIEDEIVKNVNNHLEPILKKEETINQIFYEIEGYYDLYNLPPLKITEEEWNIFFDGLYLGLQDFSDTTYYYVTLFTIVRFTLAKSLLFNYNKITIIDFINNLYYLNEDSNIFTFSLEDFEISFIKSEMLNKINKVINFEEYKLKREK